MIVVTLAGGLGNQLFQYAMGRQLAIKNNTTLKLYTTNIPREEGRHYALHHFNIQEVLATENEVEKLISNYYSNSLYAKVFRRYMKYRPKYKRTYFVENTYWHYEPEALKVSPDVLMEGFWQHYKYYEQLHPSILKEITPKKQPEDDSYKVIRTIEADDASVSLHIRRGDYASNPDNLSFFGVVPIAYYQKAIGHFSSKIKNPTYYIFSDDLEWVKDNLKADVPMVYVDIEGGKKDYLELNAMSKCRHNIIANSSFSWWGAFLNSNPEKIVIAPEKWVVQEDLNKHIQVQLPSWVKM